jgi:cell division septum initiation protein DivIVA
VDVKQLIDELRSMVEGARSMPMSSSAVINRSDVLAVIRQLEEAVPEALAHSDRVFAERDAVVADAMARAERILVEAHLEREALVSETDVHKMAIREAEQMRDDAKRECDSLRRDTDEYIDTRLANFEISLHKTLDAVTRGRDRLHGRWQLDQSSLDSIAEADAEGPPLPLH